MIKLFAYITGSALGDFTESATMATTIRDLFDEAELHVLFRDNRPYKKFIVQCIPNATTVLSIPPDGMGFPIEAFDPFGGRGWVSKYFEDYKLKDTDLILAGTMLSGKRLASIAPSMLRVPDDAIEASDNALMSLGLDPERWIATVYWKEPGYEFRIPDDRRDITNAEPYIAVIRHIIENLGGQVVRLGHQTATELPALPGIIDLARQPSSEWLQLYASSISRFMLCSLSGPASYGPAFNVPTVVTDANKCLGGYRAHDYILTQGYSYNGRTLRQTDAYDAGYLFLGWELDGKEYGLFRNTAEELIHAADEMFKSTRDCLGWRGSLEPTHATPRPNAITLPVPEKYPRDLLIAPSQRIR